jgi:3-hydroxyanthranilate 3,4-dioxygenase
MKLPAKLNLARWIQQNAKDLKPPVSNKQLFNEAADVIVFVSGGPNTRNDFHVNPTEELFYQLKGDIAVRVRPLDGSEPHDIVVQEGEMFMLPRWLPHRPQRPAGTVGLIMEFPRGFDVEGNPQKDALRWYCPACDAPVYEAQWILCKIDEDLKIIMEQFWQGPAERRTCRTCGTVIERGTAIELAKGAVSPAKAGKAKLEIRNSKKRSEMKKSKVKARKPKAKSKLKKKPTPRRRR